MNKQVKIVLSRDEFLSILQEKGVTLPKYTGGIKISDGPDDWAPDINFPLVISWVETAYSLDYRFNNGDDLKVDTLIKNGQLIDAIKLVRALTGWGLKESKDYVEHKRGSL